MSQAWPPVDCHDKASCAFHEKCMYLGCPHQKGAIIAPTSNAKTKAKATPRRRPDQKEHRLQAYCDRFIDRVVLPPFFTSGIDAAQKATDNQRARAAGRGLVFGLPDCVVFQGDGAKLETIAFIEYKRGTGLTARQEAVHAAMERAGMPVYTASSIMDLYDALKLAGFRMHGNAANIAQELELKLSAADDTARAKLDKPSIYKARVTETKARKQAWARIQGAMR